MSWQLASFAILALALASGFAWYERSRPPARVLALVAALAALAVVGRLAFAAFPNVKPTTDVVVLAGFALGPAPGFAVGAVTALASNVFLTQGPWTAWQMAAWGGLGAAGGLLARALRGRTPGRLALAAICGLAGLVFGAILDVYQWTFAAERTLDSYVTIAGTSLPYNVAHAAGNVVFCLAFGPAFLRVVARYRRRFEFSWRPAPAAAAPLVAAAVAIVALAGAEPAGAAGELSRGLRYVERAQNADGGFGAAPGQGSSQLHSGWAALGAAAAGRNPRDLERRGRSPIDFARARARELTDPGEIERTILMLRAAGLSPRRFGGRDLVAELLRRRRDDGSIEGQVNWTAFGILALSAAGERPASARVRAAARWLERAQSDDGGFGFAPRGASDVDDTGAVLQALAAAGRGRSPAARRAIGYLRRLQNPDGGWGQAEGRGSNAQSTAWAVQGLVALRRDPERLRRGRGPLAYLRSLQVRNGSFRYSRTSAQTPVWVTAQALAALARKPFPLAPVRRARARRARSAGAPSASPPASSSPSRPATRPRARSRRGGARPGAAPERARRPLPGVAPPAAAPSAPLAAPASGGDEGASGIVVAASVGGAVALLVAGRRWWRRRRAAS